MDGLLAEDDTYVPIDQYERNATIKHKVGITPFYCRTIVIRSYTHHFGMTSHAVYLDLDTVDLTYYLVYVNIKIVSTGCCCWWWHMHAMLAAR